MTFPQSCCGPENYAGSLFLWIVIPIPGSGLDQAQTPLNRVKDRQSDGIGDALFRLFGKPRGCFLRRRDELPVEMAHDPRIDIGQGGRLFEMARHDLIEPVMPTLAERHRELRPAPGNLASRHARLRAHHVVERGHPEPAAGTQEQAEILGMAIGRADEPERRLRPQDEPDVAFRFIASLEERDQITNPRAAIGLVFERRGNRERLAAILLWQADEPPIGTPDPVEALDD